MNSRLQLPATSMLVHFGRRAAWSFLVSVVAASLCVSSANADLITFQQGVNGYFSVIDTDVSDLDPDGDHSANANINMNGFGGFPEGHGLIRFDFIFGEGAGQIRAGSQIDSAILTLRTISGDQNTINGHKMLAEWASDASWNNTGNGIQADDVEARSTLDFSYNGTSPFDSQEVDVTATVQEWSNASGENRGWVMYNVAGGTYNLASSDQGPVGLRPMLTVNYSPVPEPSSTIFLIGATLAGAIGYRWKRRRKLSTIA